METTTKMDRETALATLDAMVIQHEEAGAAEKAAKATKEALAEAIMEFATANSLWETDDKGTERVSLASNTLTKVLRVTESLMDAFKAYRVEKLIPLKVLQDAIKFDATRLKLLVKRGVLAEETRLKLVESVSTSTSIKVSRPSR